MKRNSQFRNTQQRRHSITQILQEQGEVSVEQLVQLFDTSEVTIRKDLTALENSGFLLRKYGGAILMPKEIIDETENEELSKRKFVIAQAAAERIRDHNRIIVDSGSTTATLIKQLNRKQGTNDRRHLGYSFRIFPRPCCGTSATFLRLRPVIYWRRRY